MRRRLPNLAIAFAALTMAPAVLAQADAQTQDSAAAAVISVAKAQWAAEIANQPASVVMQDIADEYTEFNPDYPTRLDGKDLALRLSEAFSGGADRIVAADMANPKVQVYGDVAILSYNFIGAVQEADGDIESVTAKSTRVYVRMNGAWRLVHANFAPVGD